MFAAIDLDQEIERGAQFVRFRVRGLDQSSTLSVTQR